MSIIVDLLLLGRLLQSIHLRASWSKTLLKGNLHVFFYQEHINSIVWIHILIFIIMLFIVCSVALHCK